MEFDPHVESDAIAIPIPVDKGKAKTKIDDVDDPSLSSDVQIVSPSDLSFGVGSPSSVGVTRNRGYAADDDRLSAIDAIDPELGGGGSKGKEKATDDEYVDGFGLGLAMDDPWMDASDPPGATLPLSSPGAGPSTSFPFTFPLDIDDDQENRGLRFPARSSPSPPPSRLILPPLRFTPTSLSSHIHHTAPWLPLSPLSGNITTDGKEREASTVVERSPTPHPRSIHIQAPRLPSSGSSSQSSTSPSPSPSPTHAQTLKPKGSFSSLRSLRSVSSVSSFQSLKKKLLKRKHEKGRGRELGNEDGEERVYSSMPSSVLDLPSTAKGKSKPKPKRRAYTSPLPLGSTSSLTSQPQPQPKCHFDAIPDEIQLEIFQSLRFLSSLPEKEKGKEWTLSRAVKEKWTGESRAIRELVRVSRVNKAWHSLSLSGPLWSALKLRGAPFSSSSYGHVLGRFVQYSGPYLRYLDLEGHARVSLSSSSSLPIGRGTEQTQLTTLILRGCTSLTSSSLHSLLERSSRLRRVILKGLPDEIVSDETCSILASSCPLLRIVDVGRCKGVSGEGIVALCEADLKLKVLRMGGVAGIDEDMCRVIGRAVGRGLEVLDMSGCDDVTDECVEALVDLDFDDEEEGCEVITLKPREAGHHPSHSPQAEYKRRRTALRHLSLSSCTQVSDTGIGYLAFCVPQLEFLELAGIGEGLGAGDGLVSLFKTTPLIRRVDLEEAGEIRDEVLEALTPITGSDNESGTGNKLEWLTISYAAHVSNDAIQSLIRHCARLRVLEVDNTRVSQTCVKEFIKLARRRTVTSPTSTPQQLAAEILAIDCRTIGESLVRDLAAAGYTRTRHGVRSFDSRKLAYVDFLDHQSIPTDQGLTASQDECDPRKVVFKCFWSWSGVDHVKGLREKVRAREREKENGGKTDGKVGKWLSLARGGGSGSGTPRIDATGEESDDFDERSCVVM